MEEERGKKQSKILGCKSQILGNDAIEDIILRLPPPSLARFKCVSRFWCRRLSKPSFIDRYKARNLSLLGFLYNKSYDSVRFDPIFSTPENPNSDRNNSIDIFMENHSADNSYCIVNSSNGLQLLYFSNFLKKDNKRDPYYVVRNFATGGVTGIPKLQCVNFISASKMIRFLVSGFYFDPYGIYNEKPNFTIVEVTSNGEFTNDMIPTSNAEIENDKMIIFRYNSLSDKWIRKVHDAPFTRILGGKARKFDEHFKLSGPSTFLNGSLHWLAEPTGIVSIPLRDGKIFFWMNIPGDRENYWYNNAFCRCTDEIREGGYYSNGDCSCRYLGEVRDQLVYIRVTGDFVLSMWTTENYYKRTWSHCRRIIVGNLPPSTPSLYFGRVLAFDRKDAHVLYLRVKRTVFSYNIIDREAKMIFEISKDYGGEENCLGFVIPYEYPRIPLTIWDHPLIVRDLPNSDIGGMIKSKAINSFKRKGGNLNAIVSLQNIHTGISQAVVNSFSNLAAGEDNVSPTAMSFYDYCPPVQASWNTSHLRSALDPVKMERYKSTEESEDGRVSLFRHFGVSQVAVKYFCRLQPLDDISRPPVRSLYDFRVSNTYMSLLYSLIFYNDLVRVEAFLYGSVYERAQRDAGQIDD